MGVFAATWTILALQQGIVDGDAATEIYRCYCLEWSGIQLTKMWSSMVSFLNPNKYSFYKQSILQMRYASHKHITHWPLIDTTSTCQPLGMIYSSQHSDLANLCALFVKGIFHQIIVVVNFIGGITPGTRAPFH